MKLQKYIAMTPIIGITCFSINASSAATIINATAVANQPNWFTAGYGSVGHSFFTGDAGARTQQIRGGVLGLGGSVSITANATGSEDTGLSSIALENPAGGTFTTGAWYSTGLATTALSNVFTMTFGAGSPTIAKIGILLGATEFANNDANPLDYPASISLAGTGATTQTQAITVPGSAQADWYFFDVTDITEGDTFTLDASRVADIAGHRFNPINGVAISAIPEPSAFALLGLGSLGLFARRRRA